MEIEKTNIEGLLLLKPRVLGDQRGYFFESYRTELFLSLGINARFVQDNESLSGKGVLRGLHFQNPPHAQGKLVRVVTGAVLDVAVDIRKGSPTYGRHVAFELNDRNKHMVWIPEGFAHGFLTLSEGTIFQYKCTNYYNKDSEGSIRWNDPDLAIDWQYADPVVSEKDRAAPHFNQLKTKFKISNG